MEKKYCFQCQQELKIEGDIVCLELSTEDGLYHILGEIPEEQSQGCFIFGKDCAKTILRNGGVLDYDKYHRADIK